MPELLIAIIFALDHNHKFVSLDTTRDSQEIWSELVPEASTSVNTFRDRLND